MQNERDGVTVFKASPRRAVSPGAAEATARSAGESVCVCARARVRECVYMSESVCCYSEGERKLLLLL